jgi:hypothetical protein
MEWTICIFGDETEAEWAVRKGDGAPWDIETVVVVNPGRI